MSVQYVASGREAIEALWDILEQEEYEIRYMNIRYKVKDQKETRWKANIQFTIKGEQLIINEVYRDGSVSVDLEQLEHIKLRPYYYASCIGFKEFICYVQNG